MKHFVKITLNESSIFERRILENLTANRAGSLKQLAYECLILRGLVNQLSAHNELTVNNSGNTAEVKPKEKASVVDIFDADEWLK